MANLITLGRFLLLLVLVMIAYLAEPEWRLINGPLLLLTIALDGVDGYVARKRRETSAFGSVFDIAVDRVVENVLWVALGHLGLVPIWVSIVFIIRGTIVDSIRYAAVTAGETPFGMMRSSFGRFLVAGRFMRGFYGVLKAITFGWVLLFDPWPALFPAFWADHGATITAIGLGLVYASVAICLARGVPVVAEFVARHNVFGGVQRVRPVT